VIEAYEPSARRDLGTLTERVWGERPSEDELAWWHEAPGTTTLVARTDDGLAGSVTMSLVRLLLGGVETSVGIATRLATDPSHRGRGVFAELQRASEERAAAAGAQLLLVVPNAASRPIFLERLGWSRLAPLRVRLRLAPRRLPPRVAELRPLPPREGGLVRDADYLRWRFGGARRYRLHQDGRGYVVVGRRGRLPYVAATGGDARLAGGGACLPPCAGLPLPRSFDLLGRSLGAPLPERVQLELGDLDFL
jgi:GNAT superfamily N-acetyltransferase